MYSVYKTVSETIVMEQNSNEIIELKWNLTTKGRRKLSKDGFL